MVYVLVLSYFSPTIATSISGIKAKGESVKWCLVSFTLTTLRYCVVSPHQELKPTLDQQGSLATCIAERGSLGWTNSYILWREVGAVFEVFQNKGATQIDVLLLSYRGVTHNAKWCHRFGCQEFMQAAVVEGWFFSRHLVLKHSKCHLYVHQASVFTLDI